MQCDCNMFMFCCTKLTRLWNNTDKIIRPNINFLKHCNDAIYYERLYLVACPTDVETNADKYSGESSLTILKNKISLCLRRHSSRVSQLHYKYKVLVEINSVHPVRIRAASF